MRFVVYAVQNSIENFNSKSHEKGVIYMAFFDEVGKKIASTSQGAVQKTKIIAETVKLNSMISNEERNINNAYLQVGKLYYETYGAGPDQLFSQFITGLR